MRQAYLDLQKKHQQELSDFPIAYAFSEEQLKEALVKLGAESKEECVTIFGHGDIVKRENAKPFLKLLERQTKELKEAMKNKEFAEAAFLYEMDNHEYAINWSADEDVLACFNMSFDDLRKLGLESAYRSARNQHMKNAEEWGMI